MVQEALVKSFRTLAILTTNWSQLACDDWKGASSLLAIIGTVPTVLRVVGLSVIMELLARL